MNKQWDQLMVQTEPPAPTDHDARVTARTNDESTAGALHFHELVSILRRRSRLILWITLCGAMVVFVAALLMPPKYTAKAQVAIDAPSSGPQAVGLPREVGIIETHVTIL